MIQHISIFLPSQSAFHTRIFNFLSDGFKRHGLQVTGACRLLDSDEMHQWVVEKKPCVVFEMNRVKDEIPILHELDVMHISWVVDFKGRDEGSIRGSDITYFFDSGCDDNYVTGGFQDWLPPGACMDSFFPQQNSLKTDFSFVGHIPRPWSNEELSRTLADKSGWQTQLTFGKLLRAFNEYMEKITYRDQTHASLIDIINELAYGLAGVEVDIPLNIRYDLLERVKRVKNRNQLISFAQRKSNSIDIYGPNNWCEWQSFKDYYRYYVDSSDELRSIYQQSNFNLHDGICFHFRAIDCMAAGGLVFWYNENSGSGTKINLITGKKKRRGLHNYFDKMRHYIEFFADEFDLAYEEANLLSFQKSSYRNEVVEIIKGGHTWQHRAHKILADIQEVR